MDASMKEGYLPFASLMRDAPKFAIFHRFKPLQLVNLSYLQAEVKVRAREWKDAQEADRLSDDEIRRNYHLCYEDMLHHEHDGDEARGTQRKAWLRVADAMQKFHDAMIRYQKINEFPEAKTADISDVRHFLEHSKGGRLAFLNPYELFDETMEHDLLCLNTGNTDALTGPVEESICKFYHGIFGKDSNEDAIIKEPLLDIEQSVPFKRQDDKIPQMISKGLCAAVMSALVTVAIWTVYVATSNVLKMMLIMLYNFVVTFAVVALGRGKLLECFIVCAAFAACLVTVVGSPMTPNGAA